MASISSSCSRAGRGTPARRPALLRTELMIFRLGMRIRAGGGGRGALLRTASKSDEAAEMHT
eukprot:775314-Prymnesium_polylepis.1